jgi:DNA-binding transcriptional LysR family regulator
MEEQVSGFARKVAGHAITPAGEVRIATADTLFVHLLTPLFARFQTTCPDIRLDIAVGNPPLNLSRRDADVAIRATDSPPENLVGRRAARLSWALYARAADFPDPAVVPAFEALVERRWVGLDEEAVPIPVAQFVRAQVPAANLALRASTVLGLAEAIEAGIGIGYLPCFVGDVRPSLRRLAEPDARFATDLWLLTHPDLRQSPRIRILLDFLAAELATLRPLLEGNGRSP